MAKGDPNDRKGAYKKFAINIVVAVSIVGFIALLDQFIWGQDLTDSGFDWIIKVEAKRQGGLTISETSEKENMNHIPVFFFEITGSQYKKDGFPVITPRSRIAYLLRKAWEKKVPVVVIDIALEHKDHKNPRGDKEIRNLLTEMMKRNSSTNVIFSVIKRSDDTYNPLIVDDLIDSPKGRQFFHRAIPGIKASYSDGVARFWVSHDLARSPYPENSDYKVLWGVPILATALIKDMQTNSDYFRRLADYSRDMENRANRASGVGKDISEGKVIVFPGDHQAIEFQTPEFREVRRKIRIPFIPDSPSFRYRQRIRFRILPGQTSMAGRQFSSENMRDLPEDVIKKGIVVIGNSSYDSGDVHQTPMRSQTQGIYIVGNAINTVSNKLMPFQIKWLDYLVVFLAVIFSSYVFTNIKYSINKILISFIFLSVYGVISMYLYERFNLFMNYLVPISAIALYTSGKHTIEVIKDIFEKKSDKV